jgi:hypothetical protein
METRPVVDEVWRIGDDDVRRVPPPAQDIAHDRLWRRDVVEHGIDGARVSASRLLSARTTRVVGPSRRPAMTPPAPLPQTTSTSLSRSHPTRSASEVRNSRTKRYVSGPKKNGVLICWKARVHEQQIADRRKAELRLVAAGDGFERFGIFEQLDNVLLDRLAIERAVPAKDRFERGWPFGTVQHTAMRGRRDRDEAVAAPGSIRPSVVSASLFASMGRK